VGRDDEAVCISGTAETRNGKFGHFDHGPSDDSIRSVANVDANLISGVEGSDC